MSANVWMTFGSSSLTTRRSGEVDRRTLRETRNGAVVAGRDLCTGERTTLLPAAGGTGSADTVSRARAMARTQADRLSCKVEEYMVAGLRFWTCGVQSSSRKKERADRAR